MHVQVIQMANLGNPISATRPWPNLVTSKPSPPPLEPCFIVQTIKNHNLNILTKQSTPMGCGKNNMKLKHKKKQNTSKEQTLNK